jgi:hypothetical protein
VCSILLGSPSLLRLAAKSSTRIPCRQAGQFIGARADFVPEQICRQMCVLQDRVRSFGPVLTGHVRRVTDVVWRLQTQPAVFLKLGRAGAVLPQGGGETCAIP